MDYSSFADAYQQTSSGSSAGSSVISLACSIIAIVAWWFLNVKAGEQGWAAIIPFYNVWVQFRIVYGSGLKCLLLLVPILNIVVYIMFSIRLAKVYGQGIGIGIVCLLFPTVGYCILAFGPGTYRGPVDSFL
ncbi:MAG: hypothetical protein J5851_01935 [Oscillospiraceae bacterium]|nr:hypothetical protein [Oscillospiraceae bacterium]